MRLEDLLYDALEERGVRVTTGFRWSITRPTRARRPRTVSNGSITSSSTGTAARFPTAPTSTCSRRADWSEKGVRSERERVFEPIFDCHVPHAADRYDWFVDDVFGDQPYARFGLPVDRDLRPLDASDEPEFSNLRAAGAVLGGYDFAAEKSGAGVSLATGYVAGRRAASEGER